LLASATGAKFLRLSDARSYGILIEDLACEEVRERLRAVWLDPMSLAQSRHSARVTRGLAGQLAVLARSLEESGYRAERAANFLYVMPEHLKSQTFDRVSE
jgi:hypothetical protein